MLTKTSFTERPGCLSQSCLSPHRPFALSQCWSLGNARKVPFRQGFTLIEVMIAVAIFAVISAIVFPIVVKTIDTNSALEKKSIEIASLQRLFIYMENDFRYMVQRTIRDPIDGLSFDPSFAVETADDELIKFFTLSPDANTGESRTRLVAWVLDGDKLQRKTWFSISPYTDEEPRLATVVEGIESIELQLAEKTDDAINWRPDWDNADNLPSALEINVQFADGVNYRRLFEIAETLDLDQQAGNSDDPNDPNGANSPNGGVGGSGQTGGNQRGSNASGSNGGILDDANNPPGFPPVPGG